MKQACLKIQIMASAADRCIRTIVTSSSAGFPRILPLFYEVISNKNAMASTRRIATEYLCLATSLWPNDILDKNLSQLKSAIKIGAADAGNIYVYFF